MSLEPPPVSTSTAAHDGDNRYHATNHQMMQVRTPEVRKTIPNLLMCSVKTGNVGDERNVEKRENDLRKGTSEFV
jgi:hypothetical protein